MLLATLIGGYNLLVLIVAEDMNVLESVLSVRAVGTAKGIRRSEVMVVGEPVYPKYTHPYA